MGHAFSIIIILQVSFPVLDGNPTITLRLIYEQGAGSSGIEWEGLGE